MNYGSVNMQGIDLGLTYLFPEYRLTFDTNFSFYKSTEYYNSLTKKNDPINAPKFKMNASINWASPIGDISLKYRHVDQFVWKDGIWSGIIGPYDLFDVFYSRKLNDYLELNLTVQNIFDQVHKEMIGGANMGRQLIMRLSASL
jgi:iron complex outermembrane receptor protein